MTKLIKKMTKEDVKNATDKLLSLPVKLQHEISVRQYVQMKKDEIYRAMDTKGYNMQDIVDLLAEHGVQISAQTLASYLRSATPKKRNTRVARKAPPTAQTKNRVQTDVPQMPDGIQNTKTTPTELKKLSERMPSFDTVYNDSQ